MVKFENKFSFASALAFHYLCIMRKIIHIDMDAFYASVY